MYCFQVACLRNNGEPWSKKLQAKLGNIYSVQQHTTLRQIKAVFHTSQVGKSFMFAQCFAEQESIGATGGSIETRAPWKNFWGAPPPKKNL